MISIGFIGCGGIARHHAGIIDKEVPNMKVVAGADTSEPALKQFQESFGVADLYSDYRDLLKKADVDAVCVALPTHLHKAAVIDAAKAGKHVFCEKPMARKLADCDRMIEACDKAGVTLMVGQVRRYDKDWGTWKKLVEKGSIGRPVLWRQTMGSAGPGRWFMDDESGGGPFLDGCVHNWDFANLVFGRPALAVGSIMTLSGRSALDSGTAVVQYESGDEVSLCWSWGLPQKTRTGANTDILGPKGTIRFPGSFPPAELPPEFDAARYGAYLVDTGTKRRVEKFRTANMFAAEWKDFRDAVVKQRAPLVTGQIGKEALEVALAVLKAGRTRKPVKIGRSA